MCKYCKTDNEIDIIIGDHIPKEKIKKTIGYKPSSFYRDDLDFMISKGKADKKAGLMITTMCGTRYIDINYCPFCGRKVSN